MSTNRINKIDVYDFLRLKEQNLLKEKIDPISKERKELMDKKVEEFIKKHKINIDSLVKNLSNVNKEILKIRDNVSYTYSNLYDISRKASYFNTKEIIFEKIRDSINFDDFIDCRELKTDIETLTKEIKAEFRKLHAMVKACNTGNQAVRRLKDLGFDTSEIKSVSKNEIAVLNIDSNLLNLPEKMEAK